MDVIQQFRKQAGTLGKTIVLPEGNEERVIRAAGTLAEHQLVRPVLLGDPEIITATAAGCGVSLGDIEIIDPENSEHYESWVQAYYELRKHKGVTEADARKAVSNPLFFAAFMIRENMADGAVAGSINTTGDVLRAAIQVVGLAENVSSSGMRIIPDSFPERITNVHISFKNNKDELFEISGNIVWYEKIKDGRYKIGVEFNEPVDQLTE